MRECVCVCVCLMQLVKIKQNPRRKLQVSSGPYNGYTLYTQGIHDMNRNTREGKPAYLTKLLYNHNLHISKAQFGLNVLN